MAKYKIEQARIMRKHSKKGKVSLLASNKVETIKTFLETLGKHKVALSLLAAAISVIVSTIWNIACQCGFKGYADYLGIDARYIQINYNDILVTFLIAFGITFVCAIPIYSLAQYNAAHNIKHWKPIVFSVIAIILPYIAAIIITICSVSQNVAMYILIPLLVIGVISAIFLMLYCAISSLFYDKKRVKKSHSKANDTTIMSSLIHRFIGLVLGVILLLIAIYCFGCVAAEGQRTYKLIVDDHNQNVKTQKIYSVILAENDDYYYLADCNISSAGDNHFILHIMNNNITIEAKPKITYYKTMQFFDVDIKNKMP